MEKPTKDHSAPPLAVQARPLASIAPGLLAKTPVDRYAVASAVLGLTAIVPVLSQIAGLTLGVLALRRIRRAQQAGLAMAGRGWAITGIVSSGVGLLIWLFIAVVFGFVLSIFWTVGDKLDGVGAAVPR